MKPVDWFKLMKNAFCRKITVRIRLCCLLMLFLLLCVAIAAYSYFAPGNLYFMLLRPEAVECVKVSHGGQLETLTSEETTEVLNILKDFRITKKGSRIFAPEDYYASSFQIHMKTGRTIYIGGIDQISVNDMMYYGSSIDVARRLSDFWVKEVLP